LTIRPYPPARISGRHACVTRNAPTTFVSSVSRSTRASTVAARAPFGSISTPALFTRIEPSELALDPCRDRAPLTRIAHVKSLKRDVEALARESPTGRLALRRVARGEHDSHAPARELPDDLEPDAPIRAGDDGNPLDHPHLPEESQHAGVPVQPVMGNFAVAEEADEREVAEPSGDQFEPAERFPNCSRHAPGTSSRAALAGRPSAPMLSSMRCRSRR
jgi:hypothetical protein